MADDEVVLWGFWASSDSIKVRIALEEKGIKYEYKHENFQDKNPLLLKMNPIHKMIPVLIHNGKPICESLAIVQYIDEVWNDKPHLLPTDPYQRAIARFWVDYIDKKIHHNMRKIVTTKEEELEKVKKELIECFNVLEGELGETPFFGGESTMGFVDVALISFYIGFYTIETFGNFNIELKCPKLVAWTKRC